MSYYAHKTIMDIVKLIRETGRRSKRKAGELQTDDSLSNPWNIVYKGNGFNISKCGNEYKISWMQWRGGYDKEVSYLISEENAHKATKSDQDAHDVMIFAETGRWPLSKEELTKAQADMYKSIFISKGAKLDNFTFGEVVYQPGMRGCIPLDNGWYLYSVDDRGGVIFTGPFQGTAIIYACAVRLGVSKQFSSYKFSDKERAVFIHQHYLSIEEIRAQDKAIKECKEVVDKHMLLGGNLFCEHEIQPFEVVLENDLEKEVYQLYATDEKGAPWGVIKEYGTSNCGSTAKALNAALRDYLEKLVKLNNIQDAKKAEFVHLKNPSKCHPLCCPVCELHLQINGGTPLRDQKHEDEVFYDKLCDDCNLTTDDMTLLYPLTTPSPVRLVDCHRYYIDFTANEEVSETYRILDVRRIGKDNTITDDCYILPSQMMGSAFFKLNDHIVCFVGNPLKSCLYDDYANGAEWYTRDGYPNVSFSNDENITDVCFLNKESIENAGNAKSEVLWGNPAVRFHDLDMFRVFRRW